MNDLTAVIGEMNAGIQASRERFVRPQADRRTDAELPELLRGYAPALKWHDSTIETWLAIREVPRQGLPIILEPGRWLKLFEDVLRTTGPTPWCAPHDRKDLAIQFAGHWCAPDLDLLLPGRIAVTPTPPAPVLTVHHTEITFDGAERGGVYLVNLPRRQGRWRLVTGFEALQLALPQGSMKWGYAVNQDCGYVDHRCLARYRRRARERQRRAA